MTDETVASRTGAALSSLSKAERRGGPALRARYPSEGRARAGRLAERPANVAFFLRALAHR